MRILVTGGAGRLGGRLVEVLSDQHQVTGIDIADIDITDFAAIRAFILDNNPDVVLHPAAWTDVDGCAREPKKAITINGLGTQNVAVASAEANAAMLYISTNEVFQGQLHRPYLEYDTPAPLNSYGYSKLVGERALVSINPRHYIVRTAWVFAHGGRNFIQAILGAAEAGKNLRVVTDEVANPTYNNDLADAIGQLIETERYGVYHFTNAGACSRYTFARYALDQAGYGDVAVQPISSSEWQRASIPPPYAAMTNLAGPLVGITLRPWQEAVDAFLDAEGLKSGQ